MLDFIKNLFSAANWKTTLAGLLTLVGLSIKCVLAGGGWLDCISEAWPVAFAGLGLLFAGDAKAAAKK